LGASSARADAIQTLAPSNADPERTIVINIKAREFDPETVTLQAGQKTTLVFQNLDAELHAFVPGDFFKGVNLNVSGNGAPEFGPEGFRRVIIPSQGQAAIRFVPDRPGRYLYTCDMPGHEMKAAIVVEGAGAHP
jgi:plastocyanin